MHYNIILTIDVENEEKAIEILDEAKSAVMDVLDYDTEDFVAGIVQKEVS